jgi:hypothetical protein
MSAVSLGEAAEWPIDNWAPTMAVHAMYPFSKYESFEALIVAFIGPL